MAVSSTTFGYGFEGHQHTNPDKALERIVCDIQNYLQRSGHKRFFLSITLKYHKRCCKSWSRIGYYLQNFLNAPRVNYSMLMLVLEEEMNKFPKHAYYREQLSLLLVLLESGPQFSQNSLVHL